LEGEDSLALRRQDQQAKDPELRKGNAMAEPVVEKLPLRHRAEIPMFILMVVLNLAILAVLIDFLASAGSAGIDPQDGRAAVPDSVPGLLRPGG
jgi:hypothetical protein